jgi:hypothetical protein
VLLEGRKRGLLRWARMIAYACWILEAATLAWIFYGARGAYLKGTAFILAALLVVPLSESRWRASKRK